MLWYCDAISWDIYVPTVLKGLSKSDFDLSVHHQTDKDIFDLKVNVSEIDFFVLVKFCEE